MLIVLGALDLQHGAYGTTIDQRLCDGSNVKLPAGEIYPHQLEKIISTE